MTCLALSRLIPVLVVNVAGLAAASNEPPPLPSFPPPPPAAERVAVNDAEREAGAVVLEATVDLVGRVSMAASMGMNKGSTTRTYRYRYLVLDGKGAEALSQHGFFGDEGAKVGFRIRGRTVTASGEEFPLDPEKDVRDLDVKDSRGRTRRVIRTAYFPHVEPGAVLDLAWVETEGDLPDLEAVELQTSLPIRRMEVRSDGTLLGGGKSFLMGASNRIQWVPFFSGPFPAHARAVVNGEFDLALTLIDVPPHVDEPLAPPAMRAAYVLGLMPRSFSWTIGADVWRKNLVLFGRPGTLPPMADKQTVDREIDPAAALVAFDELGLQTLPSWASDPEALSFHQGGLKATHERLEKFFRKATGGESAEDAALIAPPDLPSKERARRLFDHLRQRIRPDPEAESQKTLAALLAYRRGGERDLALYYAYLLDKARISGRIVVALSRYRIGFQPIVESWRPFHTGWLVEVSPAGEPPFYTYPGDPFGSFHALTSDYHGALAFRQPPGVDDDWTMFRIPTSVGDIDRTEVTYEATLDPGRDEIELATRAEFTGTAASELRWSLGWKFSKTDEGDLRKGREKTVAAWFDDWTGLLLPQPAPAIDPSKETDKPLVIALAAPWKPEAQVVGEQILVPALPRATLFRNPLGAETRRQPLWLDGGHYEVRMTWRLPAGWTLARLPTAVEAAGPGGLAFRLEISTRPASGSEPAAVITQAAVEVPHLLPASDHATAKVFFEAVQRAANTRLLIGTAP